MIVRLVTVTAKSSDRSPVSTRAFTLIELLVVVAIVAILAAIGLVNFLEAQTRAKVSRARTDMRTLATGMETYGVDHSAYVETFGTPKLTTPITYLTTLPQDVFAAADGSEHFAYMNAGQQSSSEELVQWGVNTFTPAQQSKLAGNSWFLWSNGPDLANTALEDTQRAFDDVVEASGATVGVFYDATNGTVSRGDLVRSPRLSR